MILKRLKLFTIYVGPNGTAASDQQLRNIASGSAVNFAGQLGLPAPDANTGANTGNNTNTGNNANANANTGANTGNNTNTGNNANTANTGANAANSDSVMQKQSYSKPGVSTNNVNSNTAQAYNKEQLDNLNKAHQQELKSAIAQSSKRGEQAGMKKAGVWQGLKNTWRSAGTMKKIGMGGAALAGTYFLGKGLLGGNNNNDQ